MPSRVVLSDAAAKDLQRGCIDGTLSLDELKEFRSWKKQVEDFGIDFTRAQSHWQDHALDRNSFAHRAIRISYSARVIYKETRVLTGANEQVEIEVKVVESPELIVIERRKSMKSGEELTSFLDELIGEDSTAGDLIRSARNKLLLTQEDIKFISGIETTTQSAIENSKIALSRKYAEIYAVIFGQHPSFFLYPNGFEPQKNPRLKALKKKAASLIADRKEGAGLMKR